MAGTELGKAWVQIVPSADGLSGSISKLIDPEASAAGTKGGLALTGGIKKAIAAAGIGVALKKTLDAGGNLQQSFGGLDTIYGDAAAKAKEYAAAAQEAGISQNSFAEQAVSFGAALKQAYEGDTAKSIEAANKAILDMADNAAKMGTPLQSIQDAYQGFAKQNYTMLDNLKLGYGGTKSEMERLLADATELSGVEYDISNLGDVYDAIHVIQQDLGLTGVAADEAATTFTGSFNAMKAAGENLMANLMLGENVKPAMESLAKSATTFLFDNLLPAVGNIFASLPSAIATGLQTAAPLILEHGKALITNLVQGLKENGPQMIAAAKTTIETFVSNLGQNLPELAAKGGEMLGGLAQGLIENLPQILGAVAKIGAFIVKNLGSLAGTLATAGLKLLSGLAKGIVSGIGSLLSSAMAKVKEGILKPIETAKEAIQAAINKIKAIFSGAKFELPKIKLPHFSISGKFSLNPPSTPKFSVSWYRKAEEQPYMFGRATLFGAGEHNDEILYGRRSLMRDIREATKYSGINATFNINVNGADDPAWWADELTRSLKMKMRLANG